MINAEIREAIKNAGLFQYQVAMKLGVTEATFIRWLRVELPKARRMAILGRVHITTSTIMAKRMTPKYMTSSGSVFRSV